MHRDRVNRAGHAAPRTTSRTVPEPLEPRMLFAVSTVVETLVNATQAPLNQTENTVAVNPTNPNQVFMSCNQGDANEPDELDEPNDPIPGTGIFVATSSDGGATWNKRVIATGAPVNQGGDGLPEACCDPSAAFDQFGNLFYAYLSNTPSGGHGVVVMMSADGGNTFTQLTEILGGAGNLDRPEITTGPSSVAGQSQVWVSYVDFTRGSMSAQGLSVTGPGLANVGTFGAQQLLPQGGPGTGGPQSNVGHVAVGPNGEVMVTYETFGASDTSSSDVFVNTDPDGVGPQPFGNAVFVAHSNVGVKETLPSQAFRGLSDVATLAWDRSTTSGHRGRVYLVYTDEVGQDRFGSGVPGGPPIFPIGASSDTEVILKFSDDNGATWSEDFRVNDDPLQGSRAQFLQRIAIDQTTGLIAVGWHDTREDTGADGDINDDADYYFTVGQSLGNGVVFTPNQRLNVAHSNARHARNGIDFGDYTGLAFTNGVAFAGFADNSNSTGDNPSGAQRAFDIYVSRVRVTPDAVAPEPPFVTPDSPLAPTISKPVNLVRKGKFYQLKMSYSHPSGINLATVGDNDILVNGPNAFSQNMQLLKAKPKKKGTVVQATYRLAAPGGTWDSAENGVYNVLLQPGAITATDGTATTEGTITKFVVNAKPPRTTGSARGGSASLVAPPAASVFSDEPLAVRDDTEALLA